MTSPLLSKTIGIGTLWSTISSILLKFISIATIFITLRYLSVYEYGLIGLILSIYSTIGIVLLPGIDVMVTSEIATERGRGNSGRVKLLLKNYFTLQAVLAFSAWLIVFLGAGLLDLYFGNNIVFLVRIAITSLLLYPINSIFTILFTAELKFFYQSLFGFLTEFLKFVFLLLSFFVFHAGVPGVIAVIPLSQLFAGLIMLPVFLSLYRPIARVQTTEKESFLNLLRMQGKWSVATAYLNTFNQNARLWLIKVFAGTEAVGVFSVAAGLVVNVASLLPLNKIVAPALPQYLDDRDRFYRMLNKSIKYQVLGYIIISLVVVFIIPYIMMYLFPKYLSSLQLFYIMIFAIIPMGFGAATTAYYAIRKQNILSVLLVFKFIVMILCLPFYIKYFGMYGIALEYVTTVSLYVWIRQLLLKRLLPGYRFSLTSFIMFDSYDREVLRRIQSFIKHKLTFL
jgi:O-antigen/teichoic acid export membrane protein